MSSRELRQRRVRVNGAFRGQPVTGQQRYATELARRLVSRDGITERRLPGLARRSPLLAWAFAQLVGTGRGDRERLVTLTSRGPLVARRHVVVVHDLFVVGHPEWYSRAYVWTHVPILRLQLRTAELVVAVSEPVARQAAALARPGTPVVVVPNAPAELFVPGAPTTDLARRGLRPGGYVLSVASDDPRKNAVRLVEAHLTLPPELRTAYPLVLVGRSSAIYGRVEVARDEHVVRLGYVEDPELADLYRGAAVVAFPSLDEGFGLPAVEAIASGAEVVVSDVEALRWVCGDLARFVDPGSVGAISAAIEAALLHPQDEDTRLAHARTIRERFSWDVSADLLTSAVTSLDADADVAASPTALDPRDPA